MDELEFVVRKLGAYADVSCCLLTENTGIDHCRHPKAPPASRWYRLRWRLADRRAKLRLRLGSWIAGVDLEDYRD